MGKDVSSRLFPRSFDCAQNFIGSEDAISGIASHSMQNAGKYQFLNVSLRGYKIDFQTIIRYLFQSESVNVNDAY